MNCIYTGSCEKINDELKELDVKEIQATEGLFCLEIEIYI